MNHSAIQEWGRTGITGGANAVPARDGETSFPHPPLPARALPLIFILAMAIALAMGAGAAGNVWRTGYFGDTDDAMRMVQVRDFIAGQGWFDLTAYRLGDPPGLAMHWSRVIDVPLAGLVRAFSLIFSDIQAERAARLAFPVILLALLLWTLMRTALHLAGPLMAAAVVLIVALSGIGVGQFQPGRIDHHAPQIVLLAFMLMFAVQSVNAQQSLHAASAAACAALSLAISIENLPFILALCAVWLLLFIMERDRHTKQLRAFSVGLLLCLPATFAATIAPSSWTTAHCDAYSIAYFMPLMAGAAGSLALSYAGQHCGPSGRLAGAAIAGLLCALTLVLFFQQCLRGPLHTVDPLLRDYWLNNVWEARNLFAGLRSTTKFVVLTIGPAMLGACLCAIALIQARGADRERWLIVAALVAAGVVATIWQIRAATSLAPLATFGGGWLVIQCARRLERRDVNMAGVFALALVIPLSTAGWAVPARLFDKPVETNPDTGKKVSTQKSNAATCFSAQTFASLKQFASARVLAPIDVGAHILAYTTHSVFAAAYHRNNAGNKSAITFFSSSSNDAQRRFGHLNADYIVFCRDGGEALLLSTRFPESLAASLQKGVTPTWLENLAKADDTLMILHVRPALRQGL